ncbi:MAG: ATP-binding protein [Maribacter sp.]|nr:ATP-binding protein [Maribacter sp.]
MMTELSKEEFKKIKEANTIASNIKSSGIPQRYWRSIFLDYQVKTVEQEAVIVECKNFAKGDYSGLIISGTNGTGKTMLASIILNTIIRRTPHDNNGFDSHKRLYTEAIKMIRCIKDTWRKKTSEQDAIDKFVKPEVLVIDEIGMQYGSPVEAQFITEIINDRYNQRKKTIILGNLNIKEITEIVGDRVVDRFREDGKLLVCNWKSFRGGTA